MVTSLGFKLQNLTIGTPEQLRWLEKIIFAIVIMNVIDAALTIGWVTAGLADEANPLMEGLLETHPVLFMVTKMALVFLGVGIMWRHRETGMAIFGIFLLFMVYYLVILVHAYGLGLVLAYVAL